MFNTYNNKHDFNLPQINGNLLILKYCHISDVLVTWCKASFISQTTKQITAKEEIMIVRKLRLQQGWSQEQLSEFSGLSIRTIQRIERGQNASVESLKSLAAVFEVEITDLTQENDMNNNTAEPQQASNASITHDEEQTIKYVKDIKDFYSHAINYVCIITVLVIINLVNNPNHLWFIWPALGWGIGIIIHGFSVFEVVNFFGPEWEKKQIEKRLGRKL